LRGQKELSELRQR